jgi:uncharacterized protein (DUF362 family)
MLIYEVSMDFLSIQSLYCIRGEKMKYPNNPQAVKNYLTHRRNFLKGSLLLSTGLLLNQRSTAISAEPAADSTPGRRKVSFVTGTDRREMMNKVLSPLKDAIAEGIKGKQIVIKPNFVSTNNPLCATHVDAVRGVLDFLKPMHSGKIIIGESPAGGSAMPGFENYGYMSLQDEYGVTLEDFNSQSSTKPAWILDRNLYPTEIQLISQFLDPKNYVISITRLKTHNAVVATMGLKNIVMGAPINSTASASKRLMHGASSRWLHYNMFLVAQKIRPHLTVIESVEGMEGNGPMNGTRVEHGVALAGTDVLAVDSIGAQLMDIPLEDIGYLQFCANAGLGIIDREKIDIIGDKKPQDYVKKYQLARDIERQLQWKGPLQIEELQQRGFGGGRRGGREIEFRRSGA